MSDVTRTIFDLLFADLIRFQGRQVVFLNNGIQFSVPETAGGINQVRVCNNGDDFAVEGFKAYGRHGELLAKAYVDSVENARNALLNLVSA